MHDLLAHASADTSGPTLTVAGGKGRPVSFGASASIALPLNAVSPLGADLSDLAGDAVDVINNLSLGSLVKFLPGVPPGPSARVFDLNALPDTGSGNLGFPALGGVTGTGTITPVDDNGVPVTQGATGLSFTGGAFAQSLDLISPTISLGGGWAFGFMLRASSSAKNSGKTWVSIGRRQGSNYGVTVSESSGGSLVAYIEDPRQTSARVQSAAYPRGVQVDARLVWTASTQTMQWYFNGVASGAPTTLTWLPEFANGRVRLGGGYLASAAATPTGAIYRFTIEQSNLGQTDSIIPVDPSTTLTGAEAGGLRIDSTGILAPVTSAGSVTLSYPNTAGATTTQDFAIGYADYVAPVETLTSYIAGEMANVPIDLDTTRPDETTLVLTPPSRGKILTGTSTDYYGTGSLPQPLSDLVPSRSYFRFQPKAGGTAAGQNPNGSTTRGSSDLVRTQQDGKVRVTNVIEMNRAPRLNGGGEAWGHADDQWVPIHALWYSYEDGGRVFPTLAGETPVVTVAEVPAAGEGFVRIGRTGANLRVGDTIAFASVKAVGWWKAGVASVRDACRLRLTVTAPTAPTGTEDYALKITDAARPAAFAWWAQSDINFADSYTRIRWANRGGDWTGIDGVWGTQPFATSAAVAKGQTLRIDVTAMVQAGGVEFFIIPSGSGAATIVPAFYTPDPTLEPMLRVTGGTRAGDYRAARCAPLADSDSASWRPANTAPTACKRTQALLLAFDGAGSAADLATATKIELLLMITSVSGAAGVLQLFRPAPQPPRPGPRIIVGSTPTAMRADLLAKVDTDADWMAMLNSVDAKNQIGSGQPTNYTIANGCYYGGIPQGLNNGIGLLKGFAKPDGTGYQTIRMGRMVGWHINYQPNDANLLSGIGVSGKSPGVFASQFGDVTRLAAGYGGRQVTGWTGYSCRSQRGQPSPATHPSTSPLAYYLAFGDYDYFLSGNTNGLTTYAINPLPRMAWVWIETVHSANSVLGDGTWANDGVYELYVNGRKQCESRRLEWRVAGNNALWDSIWFDEYNGGTTANTVDRLWPFVVGPTYVVAGTAPIAPPPGWNVPFVTAGGTPDSVPLAYKPDF